VLQSGEVRRVGSTQSRRMNVRVIGASNAPLRDLVAAGSFRADLYYRLSVLSIELPPLRDRTGDVELLTNHFLKSFRDPPTPRCISPGKPPRRWPRTPSRATCANWKTPCGAPWPFPPAAW
jgi:DNA-binding NtrC family response regulator